MKTSSAKQKITCITAILGLTTITAIAGPPVIVVTPPPAPVVAVPAPVVVVPPAPPAVTVTVGVPDTYVYDGTEYVGMVGDQYYYLSAGNVWLPLAGDRLTYFHGWEGHHHDWTRDAIRNEKYRRDAQGHDHPWNHDRDHDRDHDHH